MLFISYSHDYITKGQILEQQSLTGTVNGDVFDLRGKAATSEGDLGRM